MTDPLPAAKDPIYLDLDIPRRVPEQPATTTPAPVDVKSSVPLEVKIVPESVATLGGEPVLPHATGTPVNVTVLAPPPAPATVTKGEGITLSPTTTEQEDTVTAGQRKTAWLWERTQAITAIVVTTVTVMVLAWLSITPTEPSPNQIVAALQLNVMATLILANYFARTNHTKGGSGGSGEDSNGKYKGR